MEGPSLSLLRIEKRSSCPYPVTLLAACPVLYRLMHTFSVLVEYVSANQFVPGKERSWSPFGHLCQNFTFL